MYGCRGGGLSFVLLVFLGWRMEDGGFVSSGGMVEALIGLLVLDGVCRCQAGGSDLHSHFVLSSGGWRLGWWMADGVFNWWNGRDMWVYYQFCVGVLLDGWCAWLLPIGLVVLFHPVGRFGLVGWFLALPWMAGDGCLAGLIGLVW